MQRYAGASPLRLPVTLFSLALCCVTLIPLEVHPASRAWEWVVAVVFVLYFVLVFMTFVMWARSLFTKTRATLSLLWGMGDVVLTSYIGLAALGMASWLLDSTVAKDDLFLSIDASGSRYAVFFGDFLYMSVLVFNSVGLHIVGPRPSRVIGQLWVMTTSVWGTAVLALFLGLVVMQIRVVQKRNKLLERL